MLRLNSALCLIAGCLYALAAHAQSPSQPVPRKQSFSNSLLTIYSPDSEGWAVIDAGERGVVFGKRGTEANETYVAQVRTFDLPPTNTNDEFVGFVKKRIAGTNPPARYQEIESEYQFTEDRGYPCVAVRLHYNDSAAQTPFGTDQLKLNVVALYCRHPVAKDTGFFAAYTYRGKRSDSHFDGAAMSFIQSISIVK